ncbi:MAG: hypothetical protein PHW36_01355 [Bacilli bacterium]|nr:hypothetical protein [Bacilli bacterium]
MSLKKLGKTSSVITPKGCNCSSCSCKKQGSNYNDNTGRIQAPSYKA